MPLPRGLRSPRVRPRRGTPELLDYVFYVAHFLLELDAVRLQQLGGDEDGSFGAHRQGDGIGRARIYLYLLAGRVELEDCVKGVLAEFGDEDPGDAGGEVLHHGGQQVVGHGARQFRLLQLHEDGGGFRMADPYGQEAILALDLQEDDGLLARDIETDAVDLHFVEALHGTPRLSGPL